MNWGAWAISDGVLASVKIKNAERIIQMVHIPEGAGTAGLTG